MTDEFFNAIVKEKAHKYNNILFAKCEEYATADILHSFKMMANYLQCTPQQALMGCLAKHLVSLSDMVQDQGEYTDDIWDEKIGDSINYLFLLRALVIEEDEKTKGVMSESGSWREQFRSRFKREG